MALIRWEPVAELNTIQNEMNRLFNTFFDQPTAAAGRNANGRLWIPAMDLVEADDHYVLRADLPGLSEEDVNIQLEDNVLTISGERKAEHERKQEGFNQPQRRYLSEHIERGIGRFSRSLTLPDGVDPDGVKAQFDRGVLEITIPKPEQKKPRQVQIKLGTSGDPKPIEGTGANDQNANGRDPVAAVA
jgi:HSP20 family protein